MTPVKSWDPKSSPKSNDRAIDLAFVARIASSDSAIPPAELLNQSEIQQYAYLTQSHKDLWHEALPQFADQDLVRLVRFFTLAETQLPGWQAGSRSPVIWICRELKQRGLFPDKELINWIKTNSDNRFLPYGNPLDL